jgi:uncharacterized membrane protein YoaK (UPF0700 family)
MKMAHEVESPQRRQVVLLAGLTAVSGAVDSASYLGLGHVFTSNMTGNWVVIAFALQGAKIPNLSRLSLSFVGFVVGAMISGRINRSRPAQEGEAWPQEVSVSLIISAALQIAVLFLWLGIGAADPVAADVFALLLAVSMGCQGGAVRTLGVVDMPTVVITSTVSGLSGDSVFGAGHQTRWKRRSAAVGAFFLGGLIGAMVGGSNHALSLIVSVLGLSVVVVGARRLLPAMESTA